MKKSKQVLLSAAIAAAIMGSVSLPQIQAAEIGSGVEVSASPISELHNGKYDVKTTDKHLNTTLATQKGLENVNSELAGKANSADIANQVKTKQVIADEVNATNVNASNLNVGGQASFNDNVSIDQNLTVDGNIQASTINATDAISSSQINGTTVNANTVDTNNTKTGSLHVTGTASFDNGLDVTGNVNASTITADEANVVKSNISNLSVSGKAEFNGTDGVSISDDLKVGGHVEANTINATGAISSNQINGTTVNADNLDANTTQTGSLQVKGDARLEGTTLAKEIGAGKVVSDEIEAGKTTTDSLTVTGNTRLEGTTLAKEIGAGKVVSDEIEAGKLAVGNINDVEQAINNNKAAADNAQSTANAAKDAAAANKTAITKETNDRTAADTVLSNRITDNSTAIQSLRHDVSDLGTEIDNVGAISAALAGLHPLDWNGSGSKFQLSAAAGTYDGKQAMALGGFYHPNRNMMLSLGVSSSFGSDRKTAGNVGITFRVGKGSNGTVSDDVAKRLAAMDQKISQLESQNQKLTSMLAIVDPSLTKEFPDVPANHWAYEAVSKLAGNDIIEGYPDGDFHGDRAMTRYEIAQVIYKALKKGGTVDQKLVKEFNKEIEAVKANNAQ